MVNILAPTLTLPSVQSLIQSSLWLLFRAAPLGDSPTVTHRYKQ